MQNFFKSLILGLFVLTCSLFCSCELEKITEITLTESSIVIYIGEFDYDDYVINVNYSSGRTEEVKLTEDMISPPDRMKLYQVGEQTITINYQNRSVELNVEVLRNEFKDIDFSDLTTTYTGENVVLTAQNLPEGTEIIYPDGNSRKNAGEYVITAILKKDGYEITTLKAKMIIEKADYDLSKITFEDKTETYDGTSKNLIIDGQLPQGLNVTYTISKDDGRLVPGYSATNSGQYVVTASFVGDTDNYNVVQDMSAVLTINKAQVDMKAVNMEDLTVTYDNFAHKIVVDESKLPAGVFVEYENNEHIDVGVYTVKAKFTMNDNINYEDIPDMSAILTIEKASYNLEGIHFDSDKVSFDGFEHSLKIKGNLPGKLEVTYLNNDKIDVGRYTISACFINDDNNYITPDNMEAELIIEPATINMNNVVQNDKYIFNLQEVKNYFPTNLPDFVECDKMVYYKVDSKLDDLSEFDGVSGNIIQEVKCFDVNSPTFNDDYIDYTDELEQSFAEDGYYVAVAIYKQNPNIKNVGVTKSQLKVHLDKADNTLIHLYIDSNFNNGEQTISVFRDFNDPTKIYTKDNNGVVEYVKDAVDLIFADRTDELTIDRQIIALNTDDDLLEYLQTDFDFDNLTNITGTKRISEQGSYFVVTKYVDVDGFECDNFITTVLVENYQNQ